MDGLLCIGNENENAVETTFTESKKVTEYWNKMNQCNIE